MKIIKKIVTFAITVSMLGAFTACQDMFEPAVENFKDEEDLLNMPAWATGLLGHAYISNPLGSWRFDDVATDDAVSNDLNNSYRKMAAGSWRADNNPQDRWQYLRASWQYLNKFIEIVDQVDWAADKVVAELFRMRFKGDAYGMRALYMYHLLMNHAGKVGSEYLGIPILTASENLDSEFNLPRNTFKECIDQLYADVDMAIQLLPDDYGDISSDSEIPEKYRSTGCTAAQYSRVFGEIGRNRMSARIARAVRAQAALLAASPAYQGAGAATWEDAAKYMAEVLNGLGSNPIAEMDPNGGKWYADGGAIESMQAGYNPKEILWRANKESSTSLESDNYPPTLFGNGRVNPTQNLVDAFPMVNGLPIDDPNSGYDPTKPYVNRDPRLSMYILYNGSQAGPQNTEITTVGGSDNNSMGHEQGKSTETGYYMKKLLCQSVNLDPNATTAAYHFKPFIRYTEIFLGYAEAANEAWGPKSGGNNSYSAYDVIKALRERAGICVGQSDPYLDQCASNQESMRELIHNERRLELCFEGFRFWDLRRWKADLNEPVNGVSLNNGEYSSIPLATHDRSYADYMIYGPIPYGEVLKFSELKQNDGWQGAN